MIRLLGLLLVKGQIPPLNDPRCTTMLAHNCTACVKIDTPLGVDEFGMPVFRLDERCTECSPGFNLSATIPEGPTKWCLAATLANGTTGGVTNNTSATTENSIPATSTEKTPDESTKEVKCSDNCLRCKKGKCTRCMNDNEWTLVDGICKTKDTRSNLSEDSQVSSELKAAALIILVLLAVLVGWVIICGGVRKTQLGSRDGGSSVKALSGKQTSRGKSFSGQVGRKGQGKHYKRRSKGV